MSSIYEAFGTKKFRRKVRAIIVDDRNRLLLIQPHGYKVGQWTFVGGGVEEGESSLQAIQRELKEEVGIVKYCSVRKSEYKHRFEFNREKVINKNLAYIGQSAEIFLIKVKSSVSIKIQVEEIQNYCWVPIEKVDEYVTVPAQLKLFQTVLDEMEKSKVAS